MVEKRARRWKIHGVCEPQYIVCYHSIFNSHGQPTTPRSHPHRAAGTPPSLPLPPRSTLEHRRATCSFDPGPAGCSSSPPLLKFIVAGLRSLGELPAFVAGSEQRRDGRAGLLRRLLPGRLVRAGQAAPAVARAAEADPLLHLHRRRPGAADSRRSSCSAPGCCRMNVSAYLFRDGYDDVVKSCGAAGGRGGRRDRAQAGTARRDDRARAAQRFAQPPLSDPVARLRAARPADIGTAAAQARGSTPRSRQRAGLGAEASSGFFGTPPPCRRTAGAMPSSIRAGGGPVDAGPRRARLRHRRHRRSTARCSTGCTSDRRQGRTRSHRHAKRRRAICRPRRRHRQPEAEPVDFRQQRHAFLDVDDWNDRRRCSARRLADVPPGRPLRAAGSTRSRHQLGHVRSARRFSSSSSSSRSCS